MTEQAFAPGIGPRQGEWVTYLQALLKRAGFETGRRTTHYGRELESTLVSFQKKNGLQPDGIPTGPTWAELIRGSDVNYPDPVLEIDWAADYPEIYRLAASASIEDYLRDIDLSVVFEDASYEDE
jgi:peptidoglycan hydrolase-like protein with peptidoglycan-binding domain